MGISQIPTGELNKKEISCRFIGTLIKLINAKGMDESNLFSGLAFPSDYYKNPANWISRIELEEIERRAVKLTKEKTIMYQVGFSLPEFSYFGHLKLLTRILLNPLIIYKEIQKFSKLFNRTLSFNIKTIRPAFIEFSMRDVNGNPISENQRYYMKGVLAAIPTIWKLKPAAVFEKKDKDVNAAKPDFCIWEIYWEQHKSCITVIKDRIINKFLRIQSTIDQIEKNFARLQQRNEELIVQNEQLARIREIALKADGSRTLEDMYRGVIDEAGKIPGVGFIMVYCKNDRDKVEIQYHSRSARESIKRELAKYGFGAKNSINSSVGMQVFKSIESLKSKEEYKRDPHVIMLNNLSDIFKGNLPRPACNAIQKLYSADKIAIVPVMVDGIEWGTLVVLIQNIVPVHLLEMIASHLAVAVKNVSTMQYLENKNIELAVLNDFSMKIANVLDLEKIFNISVEEIKRLFNSDSSCIYVFNDTTGDLELVASSGDTEKVIQFHECLEKNDRLLDRLLNSEHTVNNKDILSSINDILADDNTSGSHMPDWPFITAKLQLHKKPYGFIIAGGHKEKSFTETDQSLLIAVCNQISIGIENAKLHGDIVLRMNELESAKNMLAVSEDKLKRILESVDIGIMTTDLEGNIVQINEAAVALYGYITKLDLIGINVINLISESDREKAMESRKKLLETGYTSNSEITFVKQDGSKFISEINSAVLLDTYGDTTGFVLSVRDISERKLGELKLKESEEKYRTIFDYANDIMFFLDRKGNILDVNKRIKDVIGYNRGEFIGKNITKLNVMMPRNSTAILLKNFVEQMSGNYIAPYEVTIVKKNRERAYLEVNAVAIKKDGNTVNDLAIMRDITQRKLAEKELRKKQEIMYRIITSIPNSVIVVNKYLEVVLVNRAFCETFKYRKSEAERKPLNEIIDVPDFCSVAQNIFTEKNPDRQIEFSYIINNSSRTFVATYMKTSKEDILISISDLTEERRKQESMYLTDRLVSVGEMASGIAHELNNPLTSVVALSQIVANQDLPPEIKEDVLAINSEAQRAAAVVRNLLSFARKHVPERQYMQINNIIEDVLQLRVYEHRSNQIDVIRNYAGDIPEIMVDYYQMQQVFLNLLLNAEQAMIGSHKHGKLTVITQRVNNHIKISVIDDGPGISKEHIGKIFDPFFTTKEVGKGTGLGLSICYGIVNNHGGKIYAQSQQPDKGATFIVELPVN